MKLKAAIFLFLATLFASASLAVAAPVATLDVPAVVTAGVPFTATASVVGCPTGPSGRVDYQVTYTNQVMHRTYTLLTVVGGTVQTITLPASAANQPYVVISAKVGCNGSTNNFGLGQVARTVLPNS